MEEEFQLITTYFKWRTGHSWKLQAPLTVLTSCTILVCQWLLNLLSSRNFLVMRPNFLNSCQPGGRRSIAAPSPDDSSFSKVGSSGVDAAVSDDVSDDSWVYTKQVYVQIRKVYS